MANTYHDQLTGSDLHDNKIGSGTHSVQSHYARFGRSDWAHGQCGGLPGDDPAREAMGTRSSPCTGPIATPPCTECVPEPF